MNQPTITCPHCEAEITLTESLADPLVRATRKKIAEKEAEVARRESAIGAKRAELAKAVELVEQQFTTRTRDRAREDCGRGGRRRHNFCRRQTLKVSHRKLLTYSASSKNATAN